MIKFLTSVFFFIRKWKRQQFVFLIILFFYTDLFPQKLEELKYERESYIPSKNVIISEFQFNGYTNYWHDKYTNWYTYGNLFKTATLNIEKTILQNKVNIAEDIGISGLIMQEGFIDNLISSSYKVLDQPDKVRLQNLIRTTDVLVFINPETSLGKELSMGFTGRDGWLKVLKSHQYGAVDLKKVDVFLLQNGDRKLFVVSSSDKTERDKFKKLLNITKSITKNYDFYKGWFGVETLLKSVTCTAGHPIDVIGAGMNEGNSWFVFSGYMDYFAKNEIESWMNKVKLPVVTDVGFSPIFGCSDYDKFQDRLMYTKGAWINYAKKKKCFIFRNVFDKSADPYHYDGYFAIEGNKKQINNENVPFVLKTGKLDDNATSSMVLFLKKGDQLTRETMWKAILEGREVGVFEGGEMVGPDDFRKTLQMLLLDRKYLVDYFGDDISIRAVVNDYDLKVVIVNNSQKSISGKIEIDLPDEIELNEKSKVSVIVNQGSTITKHFKLQPTSGAMDHTNPVAIKFLWNGKVKRSVTMLDLPPAISVYHLLFGHSPKVKYPVTIHNFTKKSSFPVIVEVVNMKNEKKTVFTASKTCKVKTGLFKELLFDLKLPEGKYSVRVSALGMKSVSQLGVGEAIGTPFVYEVDLNGDSVMEYRMENDSVQVILLSTGARIIEYIVKSRNDNL